MSRTVVHNTRHYKYYDMVMAGFVTVLLCSNMIGPAKSCAIELPFAIPLLGSLLVFGAGNLFFPISYIFGDILTEVYGFARARKVIWAGFGAMIFYVLMSQVVLNIPPNPDEKFNEQYQPALEIVFGAGWRIVAASILAFWLGDFVNSYVLAKMKVLTNGRHLWSRTIGSTLVGQGVDSLVFYPLGLADLRPILSALGVTDPGVLNAFNGWEFDTVAKTVVLNWAIKVSIEVVMTPATYAIVGFLKRAEREDYFDRQTDFTPFSLKD